MGNIIQNLRGSVAEHSTYTGKKGVISLVTDTSAGRVPTGEIRIHDESTAGGLPISLSNGVTLKQSSIVTTNGAADKEQLQKKVKSILNIRRKLEIDASDALGVAICHGMTLISDPDSLKLI